MMRDTNDRQLLQEYATSRSEQAFSALVGRHIGLVYSAALRQMRDPHLAEEVTQTVFLRLARKAGAFRANVILSGWLFQTARFVALETLRSEGRRRQREKKAMETVCESKDDPAWEQIAPLLDVAMAGLGEADRNALLLRFFENRNYKEMGEALGTSEDAAQKRVTRALEKLRTFFARRGTVVSASVLAGALSSSAAHAVPVGLAASVMTVALSGTAAGSTLTLGALNVMAWSNLKTVAAVGVCAVTAATTLVIETRQVSRLRAENQRVLAEMGRLQKARVLEEGRIQPSNAELERLREAAAEVYKLRGEVARLRGAKDEAARLRGQIDVLQTKLKQVSPPKEIEEPQLTAEQEQEKQVGIAKLNYLKHWTLAFMMYAEANEGRMPNGFEEARQFLPQEFESTFESGEFEIVFHGSLNELTSRKTYDPSRVIVMREKLPTQNANGRWIRGYAFADGHSEIHSAPTEDGFGDWENERWGPTLRSP